MLMVYLDINYISFKSVICRTTSSRMVVLIGQYTCVVTQTTASLYYFYHYESILLFFSRYKLIQPDQGWKWEKQSAPSHLKCTHKMLLNTVTKTNNNNKENLYCACIHLIRCSKRMKRRKQKQISFGWSVGSK